MPNSVKYLIDFFLLGVIYIFLYKKWFSCCKDKLIVNSIMFLYVCGLIYFTLMPITINILDVINGLFNNPYNSNTMNFIPFDDLLNGRGDVVRQIVLNLLLMLPFGFILPLIKKVNAFSCLALTFFISSAIELLQPLFWRSFDVTDLITNTTGGLFGYLILLIFKPFVTKIIDNINKKVFIVK